MDIIIIEKFILLYCVWYWVSYYSEYPSLINLLNDNVWFYS